MRHLSRAILNGKNINIYYNCDHFSIDLHSHDYYELILYQNCEGYCLLNGVRHPVSHNCLFLMTPFDFHEVHIPDAPRCRSFVVSFTADSIDNQLLLPLSLSARVYYETPPYIAAALREIYNTLRHRSGQPYSDLQVKHLLSAILARVLQAGASVCRTPPNLSPAISRAMLFAMSSYGQELSLAEMAKRCHMSPTYFSALFHKETGKTFVKWLNDIRIDRAKKLLITTDDTVLEIMSRCGYNTPSHFIKCFRAGTGMTPNKYRAANRSTDKSKEKSTCIDK